MTSTAVGGIASSSTVVLKGSVSDADSGDTVKLQVEVKPLLTAFDGTGLSTEASGGSSPRTGSVTFCGRTADTRDLHSFPTRRSSDLSSAWVSFPTPTANAETAADFIVN